MMEGVGLSRRCSKKAPVWILSVLLCVYSAFALTQEPQRTKCGEDDYLTEDRICCNQCPPGFRLIKDCPAEGLRSTCEKCATNLYMENTNFAPNCFRCRRCKDPNEYQVTPCQNDQNTICRCKNGFYKSNIDSQTYECLTCAKCGANERERQMCTPNNNTVCDCKENYYRVGKRCEPCSGCTPECNQHCTGPPSLNTKGPDTRDNLLVHVVAGAVAVGVVMFVLVSLVTYVITRRVTQSHMSEQAPKQAEDSLDSCEQVLIISGKSSPADTVEALAQSEGASEKEAPNLPDCVPLEINTSDLIYAVLDLVPVLQVKRLVRSLGVTDTEIEQVELDYRPCREAHYQMLRAWAERGLNAGGGGGRRGMVHRPLLEELLDKLRKMHLEQAAEDLETKYDCQ